MTNTLIFTRQGALRLVGWLAVAAMLALALMGPAVTRVRAADAVDPVENDVACNNIENGADSDLVWLTTSDEGLTVHWNTAEPPDGFGTDGTVVVRACVNGQGAWSQNDTNDGIELFPWSLFGLEANPCPDESTVLGGSVDGGNPFINTQKQNGISCEAQPSEEPSNPPSEEPSNPPSEEPSNPPSEEPSNPPSEQPSNPPSEQPSESVEASESVVPSESVAPSGGVEGETATPHVTLPPTDAVDGTSGPTSGMWQMLLVVMAGLLATILVVTPSRSSRRR